MADDKKVTIHESRAAQRLQRYAPRMYVPTGDYDPGPRDLQIRVVARASSASPLPRALSAPVRRNALVAALPTPALAAWLPEHACWTPYGFNRFENITLVGGPHGGRDGHRWCTALTVALPGAPTGPAAMDPGTALCAFDLHRLAPESGETGEYDRLTIAQLHELLLIALRLATDTEVLLTRELEMSPQPTVTELACFIQALNGDLSGVVDFDELPRVPGNPLLSEESLFIEGDGHALAEATAMEQRRFAVEWLRQIFDDCAVEGYDEQLSHLAI